MQAESSYTRGSGVGAGVRDQVDADKVARLLADGCTVVFQGLHRAWPAVVDFAGALTRELGHPVQVNAYLTPPTAQRLRGRTTTPTTSSWCRPPATSAGRCTGRSSTHQPPTTSGPGTRTTVAAAAAAAAGARPRALPRRRPVPAARLDPRGAGAGGDVAAPDDRGAPVHPPAPRPGARRRGRGDPCAELEHSLPLGVDVGRPARPGGNAGPGPRACSAQASAPSRPTPSPARLERRRADDTRPASRYAPSRRPARSPARPTAVRSARRGAACGSRSRSTR